MKRRSGFTLIELICVVAILGLMVLLAVSRLDNILPKYRLRGAAREVAALLKQAQTRAAASGRDVYFQIEVGQGRYSLLAPFPKESTGGIPKGPPEYEYQESFRRTLPDGVQFVDVILGADQLVDSGRALVRMSPFGASNNVIVNLRMGDAPIAVRLNGITGSVAFEDAYTGSDALLEDEE